MSVIGIVTLLFCGIIGSHGYRVFDHGVDLPTRRPLNIGHRGSCGILPESTPESYQLAVDQGADIIECDVCITKDLQLVCLHESWMNETTDVSEKFPKSYVRTYYVADEGRTITDYFSVDFTLAELKSLRVKQRFAFRDQSQNKKFKIASFAEYIEVAQNANRPVGIYPEAKEPRWVNSLAIVRHAQTTIEDLMLAEVARYGYVTERDPCFIQSFSFDQMKYLAPRTRLPKMLMLERADNFVTDQELDEYARMGLHGIGPDKGMIIQIGDNNRIRRTTDLVARAHARGLRVHAWTFRNEYMYMPLDNDHDPALEFEDFFNLRLDGYFADFPGTFSRYLNYTYMSKRRCQSAGKTLSGKHKSGYEISREQEENTGGCHGNLSGYIFNTLVSWLF